MKTFLRILSIISLFFIVNSCKKSTTVDSDFVNNAKLCNTNTEQNSFRSAPIKPTVGLFFLDFDGFGSYIGCNPTGQEIDTIKSIIERYYNQWQVSVTLDSNIYNQFSGKKQRVVFTNSGIGFLGIAVVGSMVNGDELNPVLVWWYGCVHNITAYPDYKQLLGRVTVHELGHSLGLYHSVDYCGQNYTLPVNGQVPVMGLVTDAYVMSWVKKLTDQCYVQDNVAIISQTIKKRR